MQVPEALGLPWKASGEIPLQSRCSPAACIFLLPYPGPVLPSPRHVGEEGCLSASFKLEGLAWAQTGELLGLLSKPQVLCMPGIVVPEQANWPAPDCGSGRQPGCHGSSWAGATEPFHPQLGWLREPPSEKAGALGTSRRGSRSKGERSGPSRAYPRELG